MLQIHRQKQISHVSNDGVTRGFDSQTCDIPWVIAEQMFQYQKMFTIENVLIYKTNPDIIAQLIAYFPKRTIANKMNDDELAIYYVIRNPKLTNKEKLEIIVMLMESYVYRWF